MGDSQVTFGGNLSLAAGPVGRDVEGHVGLSKNKEVVAAYSYSKAQGLYIGATLEGAFLKGRKDDNRKFYNDPHVTAEQILTGLATPPLKVTALHRELYAIHDRRGDYTQLESSRHLSTSEAGLQPVPASAGPRPGAPASTTAPPPAPAQSGDTGLPPNWRQVFTAEGQPYYHNTATNETSWERPSAAPAPAPPAAYAAATATSSPFSNASEDVPVAKAVAKAVEAAGDRSDNPFASGRSIASQAATQAAQHAAASKVAGSIAAQAAGQAAGRAATNAGANPAMSSIAAQAAARAAQSAHQSAQPPSRPVRPPPPARPSQAPSKPAVTALYDYNAMNPDELSFKANDKLELLDDSSPDWWTCSLNGQKGLVPHNYVERR